MLNVGWVMHRDHLGVMFPQVATTLASKKNAAAQDKTKEEDTHKTKSRKSPNIMTKEERTAFLQGLSDDEDEEGDDEERNGLNGNQAGEGTSDVDVEISSAPPKACHGDPSLCGDTSDSEAPGAAESEKDAAKGGMGSGLKEEMVTFFLVVCFFPNFIIHANL